jgi:porphobilinogen deaminase
MVATHPFPIERLHYLRSWAVSEKYQEIRQENYQPTLATGAVNIKVQTPENEAKKLRKPVEELQTVINRIKNSH